jgi:N-acetylmuramoyl-L-alanine amidase
VTSARILHTATALFLSVLTCLSTAQTPQAPQSSASQSAQPQSTTPKPLPAFYRNIIVLDPGHGGSDTGARLPNNAVEKDITLAFAQRLRTSLSAAGFTVLTTRDSDPPAGLPADQRAAIANHARPLACLLLHATSSGTGVHIVTSDLQPADDHKGSILPWQVAQAPTIAQSLKLADDLVTAIQNAKFSPIRLRASVPPIDNLTCAAAAIELAPLSRAQATSVTDSTYQQHVAEAIATALTNYRTEVAPAPSPSLLPAPGAAR